MPEATLPRGPLAAALGALAFAAALWLTCPPGPGLTPDGMSYLGAAESWAGGHGLRVPYAAWSDSDSTSPLRVFPPAFPLAIGLTVRLGATPIQGARLVEAVAAGTMVATVVWLLSALTGSGAAVLGAAAVMLTPAIVADHSAVLSEPLFLACLVLALWRMTLAPDRPLGYGLAAGAATLVRYAGLSLTAACTLWAVLQPGTARDRLRRAALAALPSVLLFGAWIVRTELVARRLPASLVRPGLRLGALLGEAGLAVGTSAAPYLEDTRWLAPASALVLTLLVLLLVRHRPDGTSRDSRALYRVVGLFAACYLGVIAFSRAFVGHTIPFDDRILSPLVLACELLVVVALAQGWSRWRAPGRVVTVAAAGAWLAGAALSLHGTVQDLRENGYDFDRDLRSGSQTLQWLRSGAAGRAVFTNHPVPIYFLLHRASRVLPTSLAPDTLRALDGMLARQPSVLVGFDDNSWEPLIWPAALASRLHVHEVARLTGGVIWVTGEP
jgi:hypothetical protein